MTEHYSRRTFVKQMGKVGLGIGVSGLSGYAKPKGSGEDSLSAVIRNYNSSMSYREVGTSGIQVSAFSIGTGKTSLEILNAGLDRGINLFHTSTKYSLGQSIKHVAKAIKNRTDKVHIALKDNFSSLDKALKILGVKQVDFIMYNRHNAKELRKEMPDIKKSFLEWRDKGLVKYAGLTTHKQIGACLDVALKEDFFACLMPSMGPNLFTELKPQREAMRKKQISIIAMKTKGELETAEYPGQIAKVLSDPVIATINKGVGSLEDLETWSLAASRIKTGFLLRRLNGHLAGSRPYTGCGLCGRCEDACPNGVAAADIIRCIRYYHDAEQAPDMAAWEFNELRAGRSIMNCRQCGSCEAACPQRIPVRSEIMRAKNKWHG
ncbi:aldo/keto reductase [Fibrobacterota bacterium]